MEVSAAGVTHVGRVRRGNEDAFLVHGGGRVLAVADGMGGHAAGEVASALAVRAVEAAFPRAPVAHMRPTTLLERLRTAAAAANDAMVAHVATAPTTAGMGTTLTALGLLPRGGALVHVGDSRAYLLRDGVLRLLTRDHTWVQDQVEAGLLTAAEARRHPLGSVLTSALGAPGGPERLDAAVLEPRSGDVYLLCSDGLSGMLEDAALADILASGAGPATLATTLVEAGNLAGGVDNLTAVVARVT